MRYRRYLIQQEVWVGGGEIGETGIWVWGRAERGEKGRKDHCRLDRRDHYRRVYMDLNPPVRKARGLHLPKDIGKLESLHRLGRRCLGYLRLLLDLFFRHRWRRAPHGESLCRLLRLSIPQQLG